MLLRVLENLKKKALRKGLWFNVLSRMERGIIELCLKIKQSKDVRSPLLLKVLMEIIKKILGHLKNSASITCWVNAFRLASKISMIAVSWGSREASKWSQDINFITYLARFWVKYDVKYLM
jgi:hypothetical protein